MGISRDSRHKRRLTGGQMPIHQKKRAFEKARPAANTKLTPSEKRIRRIRVRGGNYKFRALRLSEGNFVWPSEGIGKKTRILDVVYNASDNELVSTKTLVKNCIVQIDSTPFKAWYLSYYGQELGKKPTKESKEQPTKGQEEEKKKQSKHLIRKLEKLTKEKNAKKFIDQNLAEQFGQQRLLACISSRPGQSGRADGYILEGRELEFYIKKIEAKRK